jgi:PAS domain S-box-containing protein
VDFFFDAGEQGRASRELESAEQRFRRLLDAAPDAIIVATKERVVYVNPGFMRLLGLSNAGEAVAVPAEARGHPDDRAPAIERVRRVLAGEQLPPFMFRVLRDDGSEVSLEVIDMLVEWNGQPAALAIGRDLSERRQVQAAEMRADRLTALGTLAAGVAHEINNPLAYVLLNLQYLLRELPRFDGSTEGLGRLAERLADCRHGAERVGTIVRDLRALSRSEREERTPVELESVIASAVKIAGAQLSTRARMSRITRGFGPWPAARRASNRCF